MYIPSGTYEKRDFIGHDLTNLTMFLGLASTFGLFLLSKDTRVSNTELFASTLQERPIQADKYGALLEWLKSNDAEINDKLEIRRSSQGCGYGAFVTEDVAEDELLFTVPRKACLTLKDATDDSNCGEAFSTLIEKAGPGGNTVVMAGYMAKEYLLMLEDDKNENKEESLTRWAPYLQTLPWERGLNSQEHILFWEDDMIQNLLEGSLCHGEATSLREEVAFATKIMSSIVGKSVRVARGEESEGFTWPWEAKPAASDGPPEGLPEAMKGAFVCLLTRAFQDGDGDEEKLVPMLDMLQHSDNPNVRHAMRKVDGTVEVRARQNIETGAELFNQYRSEGEESMPYSRFFTRFGFVPGITEPMENLLEDKSSIFYPQKAEI